MQRWQCLINNGSIKTDECSLSTEICVCIPLKMPVCTVFCSGCSVGRKHKNFHLNTSGLPYLYMLDEHTKVLNGTVVYRALPSLRGGPFEITLTVPLNVATPTIRISISGVLMRGATLVRATTLCLVLCFTSNSTNISY